MGARREARARRGRVSADAPARDAPKVAKALDMSRGSGRRRRAFDDSARPSDPASSRGDGRDGPVRRLTRRTPGAPRRGVTVSGDEETLARGSSPTRASSQWRGPRGAPRPSRVFSAENASCAAGRPTKTQENGRTGARSISRDSLRSEARRAPILASAFSRATRVSRTLGEAVRGASLGDLSARRGRRISRDADHGCHGTSLDLAIDRRASLRAPIPRGRAARPPGKHAPGDPLAVMVSGADAIRARRPPL